MTEDEGISILVLTIKTRAKRNDISKTELESLLRDLSIEKLVKLREGWNMWTIGSGWKERRQPDGEFLEVGRTPAEEDDREMATAFQLIGDQIDARIKRVQAGKQKGKNSDPGELEMAVRAFLDSKKSTWGEYQKWAAKAENKQHKAVRNWKFKQIVKKLKGSGR